MNNLKPQKSSKTEGVNTITINAKQLAFCINTLQESEHVNFIMSLIINDSSDVKQPLSLEEAEYNLQQMINDGVEIPERFTAGIYCNLWNKLI